MGKGAAREVYDFLMSIDYGLCHGPVDSVNQVWVKDKPIWCGRAQTRTDFDVNQPALFGGDDAEGGCVGVVEAYVGADDQVASDELAGRVGRTSATMPGYRGIAHLFFRGKASNGFRWSSNNPYLPPAKASLTRIPKGLSTLNATIMPPIGIAEDGSFIPATWQVASGSTLSFRATDLPISALGPWAWGDANTRTVDLVTDLGLTQAQINAAAAAGSLRAMVLVKGDCVNNVDHNAPEQGELFAEIGFFPDDGTGNPDLTTELVSQDGGPAQEGSDAGFGPLEAAANCRIPANTRFVKYRAHIFLWSPFTSTFINIVRERGVDYPSVEYSHCVPDGTLGTLPDANPAHVIYECLVNAEWGRGEDPALINTTSFNAAAQTYYDEFMGISFGWFRQSSVEDVVQDVLTHTSSLLFQDPATGLWELKPLRDDYSTVGIRTLDPSNCRMQNPKRRLWGETVNEIVVTYTDPQTEQEATVVAHNLGNIAIQGGVISDTRNYYAFRNPWIAQRAAERDVAEAGYPLFSCQIVTDRRFWNVKPGDVLFLSWPEDNITNMVVRVTEIDRGSSLDRKITLNVTEEIFSVEKTVYGTPQGSLWTTDRTYPADMPYKAAVTAPLPTLVRNGVAVTDVDAAYPEVGALLLADQVPRPLDIEAHTAVTKTNGAVVVESVTTFPVARSAALPSALVPETASLIPGSLVSGIFLGQEGAGDLLMLGDAEFPSEIVMLDTFNAGTGEWSVVRGVWDTVPLDWAAGTRLWQFPDSSLRSDPIIRAGGEVVAYWFLPRTSEGRLAIANAVQVDYTASDRPHLPFRPANCQLDGNGFNGVDYSYFTLAGPPPATVTATWSGRNRTTEDSIALRWTDATVAPEAGQTTVLRILAADGSFSHEITGLTGTSYAIPIASFDPVDVGFVEFVSDKGGLRSWAGFRLPFDLRQGGYGLNYGANYGP